MNHLPMSMPTGARIAEYLRRAAVARELVELCTDPESRRTFIIAARERIAAARAMRAPKLLTYRHVWTHRNRDGDWEYAYYCTWSDGSEGMIASLPWGRLEGAVELPMDSL